MSAATYYTSSSAWLIVAVLLALMLEGYVKARRTLARAKKIAEEYAGEKIDPDHAARRRARGDDPRVRSTRRPSRATAAAPSRDATR